MFVSKQALPQLLTHSNDDLIWAFVISQLIRNIQVQWRETEYPVPEADTLATETTPVSFLPLLALFQMHNPSLSCTHSPLLLPSQSAYELTGQGSSREPASASRGMAPLLGFLR